MNKSEIRSEITKTKIRTLQNISRGALLLMALEIIIWNLKKMSPALLIAIIVTCVVEIVSSLLTLKELKVRKRQIEEK